MFTKKVLLSAMIAVVAIGAVATPPTSVAAVREIFVDRAPPAPREERIPAARRGYVWSPGYWNWSNNRHGWVKGSWVRERQGYAYAPHRWVETNGRWNLERGHFNPSDRDGDGVPNRLDRAPDNPNRR